MDTTTVNIPKLTQTAARELVAKEYTEKLRALMRSHGFRKTRFDVKIDEANQIKIEMVDGSEASKIWFSGFEAGLGSGLATAKSTLNEQAKIIRKLGREVQSLKGKVEEVAQDKPQVPPTLTVDFGALLGTAASLSGEENEAPMNSRH